MSTAVDRLVEVIRLLREHCLWTAALTHASLVTYLIEESYELVEAIEDGHPEEELRGELADLLLQIVLHAEIARERGAFDLDGIAEALTAKMVRRNRHVFTSDGGLQPSFPSSVEEIIASWDEAKRAEKELKTGADDGGSPRLVGPGALEGLPRHLPALSLAQKALGRAERRRALDGVDRPDGAGGAGAPISADEAPISADEAPISADETPISADEAPISALADEAALGDFLLGVVQAARARGLDAERALRAAVGRLGT
ncbi:MazG nucleotide pyrophosphohydrolase domain-containing protein [Sinomonas halotolerans]|uniref:MazG nucleotide pyrophosphohydrolase domain-containing protein n=1 Tax=Sinomonas halotolerans TaxID=1644133 RepID=A0ABU9WUU4_9MICC